MKKILSAILYAAVAGSVEGDFSWRSFKCRATGHKCGPIWFNSHPEATEPNMECKNCGDYLG